MVSLFEAVCIDASTAEVWAHLARLEDIRLWSEAVVDARCEGAISRGVGAERTCDLKGGITITERWLGWDEGHSFIYEGEGIPLVARARNEWTVVAAGDQTLLMSRANVVLKGGLATRVLEPLVAYQSRRMGRRTMAAFKFLVENGRPPDIKHAKLPRVPSTC